MTGAHRPGYNIGITLYCKPTKLICDYYTFNNLSQPEAYGSPLFNIWLPALSLERMTPPLMVSAVSDGEDPLIFFNISKRSSS